MYGFVLVRYKNVKSGISIKIKLKWRDWYWKPRISWRFGKHFHWLCFMSWIEFDYTDVPDKIVRDHLREQKVWEIEKRWTDLQKCDALLTEKYKNE